MLASGSETRRSILEAAGLLLIVDRPQVDEAVIKQDCRIRGDSADATAKLLALTKARQVALRHPGRVVLGADQMLECNGEWFDKPNSRSAAADQIGRLSGRVHRLFSAVVALRDGVVIWQTVESAELTMRELSPEFIDFYLDSVGEKALNCVGGYQLEHQGIQLFSAVRGDHFAILGMPLLSLLAFLRGEGIIKT